MDLKREAVEAYLRSLEGDDTELVGMSTLGDTTPTTEDVKGFGYGSPVLLEYLSGGETKSAVLSTMRVQEGFGHDHFSDRAQVLLWQHSTFGRLPKHAKSVDAGYFNPEELEKTLLNAGLSKVYLRPLMFGAIAISTAVK